MIATSRGGKSGGFALILTLSLLALLMLAVFAMSTLVRVGGQVSTAGSYQTQARQNALLGLRVGLGELQRLAGGDTAVTGTGGIAGIAAGAANTTRNWCGVWRNDGSFAGWLASGALSSSSPALSSAGGSIELIGTNSVGAAASNSEHVVAGKIPITVSETVGSEGIATAIGSYAFVVSDEGVKTPASLIDAPPVAAPVIFSTSATSAQGKLRDALATYAGNISKVISYEQLALLPTPATALTPSVLQDNFHHVTLTSRFVTGSVLQSGLFNVNTNSVFAWRNLFQTFNLAPGIPASITSTNVSAKGTAAQNTVAGYTATGKSVNGPFTSVAAVEGFLTSLFPATGSPTGAQIMTVLAPMLSVRSDTFRIRGYGETLSPADSSKVEAVAFCEAIVQRTTGTAPNGLGRRFVITYFRWLGPDDI